MWKIKICMKSWEAYLANFQIPRFFWHFWVQYLHMIGLYSYHQMKRWRYKPGHVNCVCVIEIWLMSWYRYKPAPKNLDADNTHCWETTVIFLVSTYQYIASAFVFSKGPPFREPIYKNGMVLLININLKIFYFICTSRTTR